MLLVAMAGVFFVWMPGEFLDGDPHAWREEARAIVRGELHVSEDMARKFGEPGQYMVRNERNGLYYSKYGIANALLSLPPLLIQQYWYGGLPASSWEAPSLLLFNLWHVLYGVVLAALLYALAGRYSQRADVRAVFVAAAFFCTSLWFYQRAQSSEIYQTIFFTALFISLTAFLQRLQQGGAGCLAARDWACLGAAWACCGALLLIRASYGLLIPCMLALIAVFAVQGRSWQAVLDRRLVVASLLPPALLIALCGWINYVKFGAPWLTGYQAWRPEMVTPTLRVVDGLWGFFFSVRFSVFLSFPLLIFALVGLRRFAGRYRLDTLVAATLFLPTFLLICSLPSWAGEWSYGPRYLLPMLPVLALPFLCFAEGLLEQSGTRRARAWAAAALAVLLYAAYLQVQMTRVPFWTYYYARAALDVIRSPESVEYFFNRQDATIAAALLANRDDLSRLPFYAEFKRHASPEYVKEYDKVVLGMLERGNRYWALPADKRR
ncbi:MAG TPA: hypothetical protein VGI18_00335 [Burkholderiales bacterium]|jgi:hypothetical protein